MKLTLTEESRARLKANADILEKWLDGLRSDRYTQAIHRMTTGGNSACCLCVLECEVQGKTPIDFAGMHYPSDLAIQKDEPYTTFERGFPVELIEATGDEGKNLRPENWNDRLKLSFTQIADLLEHGEVEYE